MDSHSIFNIRAARSLLHSLISIWVGILPCAFAFAANSSRSEFLGAFEKLIPEEFCDSISMLKQCFTISHDECLRQSRSSVQTCTSAFKNQIPDPVTGARDGEKWGSKIGVCFADKITTQLKSFENEDSKSDACNQRLSEFIKNRTSTVENDRQKAVEYLTRNSTPLVKMISKLKPDEQSQYLKIMTDFPKSPAVTPEIHAKLWSLIAKMDLKDPSQVESLKDQSIGESLNHQVQIWQDALQSLKEGSPVKSPARTESEKHVSEISGHADFKKDDELIADIANKKPLKMGGAPTVYDESKISKMIAHLKKKQDQLDELFRK